MNHRERLAGWIYRVTANAITGFCRARARAGDATERLEREALVDAETRAPVTDADIDRDRSLARFLGSLVETLPEKYREAMRLTEPEGMTEKEAAAKAGISVSGMKSRVRRGQARLKAALLDRCGVELDRRRGIIDVRRRRGGPCDSWSDGTADRAVERGGPGPSISAGALFRVALGFRRQRLHDPVARGDSPVSGRGAIQPAAQAVIPGIFVAGLDVAAVNPDRG